MLARIKSCAVAGIEGIPLAVEVDNHPGLFKFIVVGLPDAAVKESLERVMAAVKNSGYRGPRGATVVNLAPADIRKEGSALDLPIALGLLAATDQIPGERVMEYVCVGELALDGSVRPVAGALPMAIAARDAGLRGIVLPATNAEEAGVVPGVEIIPVHTLQEAAEFIGGAVALTPHVTDIEAAFRDAGQHAADFSDVKGQAHVKRALTVAAAGGHNVIMMGPPGTGKTMLASRLPGILPDMTFEEALETTRIYSVADALGSGRRLVVQRPFRAPHHTSTTVSICGGGHGVRATPGEISLAHNGVLFLDELPEFSRATLEVLRQPLEEGIVRIRRVSYSSVFPARMILVCALNPCPCGFRTDARRRCKCTQGEIQRYMARLSGPLLDRIDIHTDVPSLNFEELSRNGDSGPASAEIRGLVQAARDRQRRRYGGKFTCNAGLDSKSVRHHCTLGESGKQLMEAAMERLGMSARAYDKVLRVARTIADLDEAETIQDQHLAEAVQYRSLDKMGM